MAVAAAAARAPLLVREVVDPRVAAVGLRDGGAAAKGLGVSDGAAGVGLDVVVGDLGHFFCVLR